MAKTQSKGDTGYSGTRWPTRNSVGENAKNVSLTTLQALLTDSIDLYNATRQAHWNLKGTNFIGLHEMLEKFYNALNEQSDMLAERMVLLGGGPDGQPTEAEVARAALIDRAAVDESVLHLERASRDTLQNLRNAREVLRAAAHQGPVVLLTSRYHLARCGQFARQLGIEAELCAAEPRLTLTPRTLWRLAGEAGYLCLLDIGTRWARLIRSRRMLERVT